MRLASSLLLTLFIVSCNSASSFEGQSPVSSGTVIALAETDAAAATPDGPLTESTSPPDPASATAAPPADQASLSAQVPPADIPVTASASPTPEPSPAIATPCREDPCSYPGVLILQRPIGPSQKDSADVTYRFGSTQSGLRDPHHGVEFLNGFGTPVLAAANGEVVVAGSDIDPISPHGSWPILFYGPYSNFYGSLVVIEHDLPEAMSSAFPDLQGPLYTLYGHLSEISVQIGEQVTAGQQIGRVGMAGVATGSHLHFEVRLGENSYLAARNPELWLKPHNGTAGKLNGAIAGYFLDSYGSSIEKDSIVLQHLPDGPEGRSDFEVSTLTYEEKGLISQPPFGESFGLGDLPAGLYRISFPMNGLRQELVEVFPGQLTVVIFKPQ